MQRISDYKGVFLNHLEGVFRPEDRHLVIELFQAFGMEVTELQFTANSKPLLAVHPNPDDRDPTNNVLFLYEMNPLQRNVIDVMERRFETDEELREAMRVYSETAQKMPPILPHFGLRFRSAEALRSVMNTLENDLSPELKARVSLWEVPAYEPIEGLPDIRQIFVRTDVLTTGATGLEQAIELQAVRDS